MGFRQHRQCVEEMIGKYSCEFCNRNVWLPYGHTLPLFNQIVED